MNCAGSDLHGKKIKSSGFSIRFLVGILEEILKYLLVNFKIPTEEIETNIKKFFNFCNRNLEDQNEIPVRKADVSERVISFYLGFPTALNAVDVISRNNASASGRKISSKRREKPSKQHLIPHSAVV